MPKSRTSMRRRTTKKRQGNGAPSTRGLDRITGDIPPGPRSDIVTRSVTVPTATSRLLFHQHAPPLRVTASAAGSGSGTLTFALSGLEGISSLQALFDLYRICAVRVSIRPENNAIGVVDPTTTRLVEFYNVIDYNDATSPSTAAELREYDNCVVLSPGESVCREFQPRMSAVVRSAAGTDYMSVEPKWLNTGSDDVLHYGMKYFVPTAFGGQVMLQSWLIDVEYWVEFLHVKGG